jgi:pimeloyl-ACP methyl ester carboxylesterase
LLAQRGEHQHYRAIRRMTHAYFTSFRNGNAEAIAMMIDFYGGAGTFAAWPERVRAYAAQTTPVNILDWASARGFPLPVAMLGTLGLPTLVATGQRSHPAMHAINAHLSECISAASLAVIPGAAHFMLSTHAAEVASLVAQHVNFVERTRRGTARLRKSFLDSS